MVFGKRGMWRYRVLFVAVLLAGSFGVQPPSGAQVRTDLFITTLASDTLDATYFVPTTPPPPAGFPGILFVHGFGGSKDHDTANGRVYAASGYMTLCYSVRGHGKSTGGSTIMATRERQDLAEVFSFFRSLPGIDTGAIGLSGGSQGGLHGLWAIADHLDLGAVSSDVIVPEWVTDMLANGSIRRTVVSLLQSSRVRYAPGRDTLWEMVRADRYHDLFAAFRPGRDVDTAALNSGTVPSLRFLKWQDHYFTAADGIAAFRNYAGEKKIYMGTRGHYSDHVESERLYHYDQVSRWLAHFLKGADNGITDEPVHTWASSSLPMDSSGYFLWTRTGTDKWPPPGIVEYPFYLSSGSRLAFDPPAGQTDAFPVINLHQDTSYTFDTGFIKGFRGDGFEDALPRDAVVFESPPLPWDVEWIGAPRMELFVSSFSDKFPLHAQIYEVDTAGVKYFVNRINYTARGWPGGEGVIDATGAYHAHTFRGGNRIRVELTNIDVTNRIDLGSHPFALPLFRDASVTILADAARPSMVALPLVQSPLAAPDDVGTGLPRAAFLQNYPNPFNGTTNFSLRLPAGGLVSLVIYNTLGQEVDRMIDAEMGPGEYNLRWEGAHHPTGVYFARLTLRTRGSALPEVTTVRKLMLVR
jgi:predicted acyl esterase